MSIENTPDTPPLTRRQLRELRNTGATPVITESTPVAPPVAPPARAAEPVEIAPAPDVDFDAVPLTRRQARLIERVRTASVPVITAEVAAAEAERRAAEEAERQAAEDVEAEGPGADAGEAAELETDAEGAEAEGVGDEQAGQQPSESAFSEHDEWTDPEADLADRDVDAERGEPEHDVDGEAEPADAATVEDGEVEDDQADSETSAEADRRVEAASVWGPAADVAATDDGQQFARHPDEDDRDESDDDRSDRSIVAEDFGVELSASEGVEVELPASFDELLTRDSTMTGSASAPSALILSKSPDTSTFDSPIAATGEVLITGTLAFPESFGSTGVVPGSADGEEVDAFLADREIPAASSPTPIAASSAVSTLKSADEIIQPPTPEKGSRLMMVLAITAGALALALVGVLVLGLVSGIFG